jgi:hypothetical protein
MRVAMITSSMALLASLVALVIVFTRGSHDADSALTKDSRALTLLGEQGERGDGPPTIDAALARRVDTLEREVRVLRREVQILSEEGPTGAGRAVDAQGLAVDEQALATAETPRVVEEKLQALVKKELEAEDARRWEWRRERIAEGNREQVASLKDEHDVDDATAAKIEEMLAAEQEQMTALFQSMRESGLGPRDLRTKAREIRTETDENVRALLNEEQALAWDEKRLDERGGWGGGGGRGGGERRSRTADE